MKKSVYFLLFLVFVLALVLVFFGFRQIISRNSAVKGAKSDLINLVFAGDMNFDRYIRYQALKKGGYHFIFDDVRELFRSADLVVANLEGPITRHQSISMGTEVGSKNNFVFTFPPETAGVLAKENIRLVNLGNNHIFNFGADGVAQTKTFLAESGVNYFGHLAVEQSSSAVEQDFADEIYVQDFAGFKILFVNYNQFIGTDVEGLLAKIRAMTRAAAATTTEAGAATAAKKERADLVVLYAHWGNEYQPVAGKTIQDLAHRFVDAGVDLVIGSHPHVVQQSEIYHGKKIYYSLGNFIFDQYFSEGTRRGLVVAVQINPESGEMKFKEYQTLIGLDTAVEVVE